MRGDMAPEWSYPPAKRGDVVDDYHGIRVPDPYRWLEENDSPETAGWIEAQDRLTRDFINSGPNRDRIRARLEKLINYPKYSVPWRKGTRWFFSKNDGLQNHWVQYWQESLDGEPKVMIDPNTFSADGTVALSGFSLNHDATMFAYSVSRGGSDREEYRVRKLDSGEEYPETFPWCKFTGIGWTPDSRGFYYNRYPKPGTVPEAGENRHCRVYWHSLGSLPDRDTVAYERPDDPDLMFSPYTTEDGEYVVMHPSRGTEPRNGIYYRRADGGTDGFTRLLDGFDANYHLVDNVGRIFYVWTDLNSPRGRLVAIDLDRPDREHWHEVLPEGPDRLAGASMAGGMLVADYLKDASTELKVLSLEGKFVRDIPLPGPGSAFISGRRDDRHAFVSFTSFTHPGTQFKYDTATGEMAVWRKSASVFDTSAYESTREFYRSKDGTRIPMFVTRRKELPRDGASPALLYGYGGFQVDMTPWFSETYGLLLERGFVLAVPCLRGGTEYGEEWHKAGMLEKKQNVFDDAIAAAEYLVANGYTSPGRLAISGHSNGGLLTAACLTQRPDLYGAVHVGVPLTDMLRFHRFSVGHFWTSEYGNAESSAGQFRFLIEYSPLHNVRDGTRYPPVLITTGDTDDRVVPAHALKFTAALQHACLGDGGPVLVRFERKAGHGGGKPLSKSLDENADLFAFLFRIFGLMTP